MTQDAANSIHLEDTFFLYGHSLKTRYVLKLTPSTLTITTVPPATDARSSVATSMQLIAIDDIYGCLCMKPVRNSKHCHLTLYQYALRPATGIAGVLSSKRKLQRSQHIFTYGKYDGYEANHAEVVRWQRHIMQAVYLRRNLPSE